MGLGARIRLRQRARAARAMGGGASSARSGPLRSPRGRSARAGSRCLRRQPSGFSGGNARALMDLRGHIRRPTYIHTG